jgi:paraquat-inducible protein B
MQQSPTHQEAPSVHTSLALEDVVALGNDLKHLLVRSGRELAKGDAQEQVEQLERWIESYRRGLSAAQKIANSGIELLTKAREQLTLALDEQLRLEDEGGNPATKEQASQTEEITAAIRRLDRLIPTIENSFQCLTSQSEAA